MSMNGDERTKRRELEPVGGQGGVRAGLVQGGGAAPIAPVGVRQYAQGARLLSASPQPKDS
jgi:hypothetical protein